MKLGHISSVTVVYLCLKASYAKLARKYEIKFS